MIFKGHKVRDYTFYSHFRQNMLFIYIFYIFKMTENKKVGDG